jgi:hypothetical protein
LIEWNITSAYNLLDSITRNSYGTCVIEIRVTGGDYAYSIA